MLPIDFSDRQRKKQTKPFVLPKLPTYAWAIVAAPVLILGLGILCMDYVALSQANTIISQIEEAATSEESRQQKKIRKLAGVTPLRKARNDKLHETYTFARVLPLPPRTATVVYSSSGRITEVLRDSEL